MTSGPPGEAEEPIACALHPSGAPPGSCAACQALLDALVRELRAFVPSDFSLDDDATTGG